MFFLLSRDSSFILSHLNLLVNNFFKFFYFSFFKLLCRSQRNLYYHVFFKVSTPFFKFFQTICTIQKCHIICTFLFRIFSLIYNVNIHDMPYVLSIILRIEFLFRYLLAFSPGNQFSTLLFQQA